MQARGLVTAAELAEELEISVATARRDLEALSAAGIPVYPQRGRGGGWALLGRRAHRPQRTVLPRDAGAVPAHRAGGGRVPRREGGAAQAGAGPAGVVPRPGRGGIRQRSSSTPPAGATGPPLRPSCSRPCAPRSSAATPCSSATATTRRASSTLGPRRQGRHLVPDRRNPPRAPHLQGRPDDIGRAERRRLRGARRFRSRRGVGARSRPNWRAAAPAPRPRSRSPRRSSSR